MIKCKNCNTDTYSIDIDNEECNCGITICYDCDAEYSKEGELLSYGNQLTTNAQQEILAI